MVLANLKKVLGKTKDSVFGRIRSLLASRPSLDRATLTELQALLLKADVGQEATQAVLADISKNLDASVGISGALKNALRQRLLNADRSVLWDTALPTVLCVAGVNGCGKTTTCAKIAHRFAREGKQVVLGACDTFRAAAVEQLETWARRAGADLVKGQSGADPASVAYNALAAGIARKADMVILDTAGRLHTKEGLMEEAKKIVRVVQKLKPSAPHETLLVLDSTNGQNALAQVRDFHAALHATGLVLTKMDAGSKAGMVLALEQAFGVPVKFVGTGEGMEDLEPFDPNAFVTALSEGTS